MQPIKQNDTKTINSSNLTIRHSEKNNANGYSGNQINMRIIKRLKHNPRAEMPRIFEIVFEKAFQGQLTEQHIVRRFQHSA